MSMAASMGELLLSGGTKGKRCDVPNAEIRINQQLGGAQGQATEIEIAEKHILYTKEKLNRILAENCGRSYEEIVAATDRDNWMSAAAGVEFGIIDKVMNNR